jgi:two-component system phosphate regulon response regulator PhoB
MMYTVLIVDDDPDVRRLVEMRLRLEGVATSVASNGIEALAALQDSPFDLVILDIMMPVMDGIEACRRIRQDPRLSAVPVLMLTARAQVSDIERGFDAGATDYMVKPFSPRELSDRVLGMVARLDLAPSSTETAPTTTRGDLRMTRSTAHPASRSVANAQ